MRLRSSAALALVTAILASPVSALACGFQCWPAPEGAAVVTAAQTEPTDGSCHREVEELAPGGSTLSAAPHDCSTHSPAVPRLTDPTTLAALRKAAVVTMASPSVHDALGVVPPTAGRSRAQDVARPGRTPDLIAPLRI